MELEKLIALIETTEVRGLVRADVTGVTSDSRQIRPGGVFVAIPGEKEDGLRYVDDALERGAVAVVAERQVHTGKHAALAQVPDARSALSTLASEFYGRPSDDLLVVGVTGTNGKTTCVYLVRDILEACNMPTGIIGTVAYEIGDRSIPASRTTPDAAVLHKLLGQMRSAGCTAAAMEVSSHALMQNRVADVDFDIVAFTNLTRDHLDYHGDMDAYFEAKARLFITAGSRKKAVGIVNVDDPWGEKLLERDDVAINMITCGLSAGAAVSARDVSVTADGVSFVLTSPWGEVQVKSRLMGRFNVSNILVVASICGAMGVPMETVAEVLMRSQPVRGRLELVSSRKGVRVFVDYAHTDDALSNVLGTLREITEKGLIAVFGCGGDRDRSKRPLMGRAACEYADHVVLTSDNPRSEAPESILEEIRLGMIEGTPCDVICDRRAAIHHALSMARSGDVVLVAGKGHEVFQELEKRTVPFDDRQVIQEELAKL